MLIRIFCLLLYITGLVLSTRALSKNHTKRFWSINALIVAAAAIAGYITLPLYDDGQFVLELALEQFSAFIVYAFIIPVIALIVGIRNKIEAMAAWAAIALVLEAILVAVMAS